MEKLGPSSIQKGKVAEETKEAGQKINTSVTTTEIVNLEINNPDTSGNRKAEELFSYFTADIIKEETLFTR